MGMLQYDVDGNLEEKSIKEAGYEVGQQVKRRNADDVVTSITINKIEGGAVTLGTGASAIKLSLAELADEYAPYSEEKKVTIPAAQVTKPTVPKDVDVELVKASIKSAMKAALLRYKPPKVSLAIAPKRAVIAEADFKEGDLILCGHSFNIGTTKPPHKKPPNALWVEGPLASGESPRFYVSPPRQVYPSEYHATLKVDLDRTAKPSLTPFWLVKPSTDASAINMKYIKKDYTIDTEGDGKKTSLKVSVPYMVNTVAIQKGQTL